MQKLIGFIVLGVIVVGIVSAGSALDQLKHPQSAEFKKEDFSQPGLCQMCHSVQYEQWSGTMHSHSTDDPFYHRMVSLAREDMPGIEVFCENCHSPVAIMTGAADPLDLKSLDVTTGQGVACDFCHTVDKATGVGNASYHSIPGDVKRGPFGTTPPIFHTVEQSSLHDSADFCAMCHQVMHPVNGLELEGTYTEFLDGPYPAEDYKCQSCHMTHGVTEHQDYPGPISDASEDIDHIWTHDVSGANVWITEMLGEDKSALNARERLARAATITIERNEEATELEFDVVVTNSGAGHMLPTGVTEERQIWLEVTVKDREGNVLSSIGTLDSEGHITGDTMILETIFGDEDGNPTHKIWRATSVISDRRIAPRESDCQSFKIEFEQGAEPALIEAKLYYRSTRPYFADSIFEEGEVPPVPVILMTKAEMRL